MKWLTLMWWRYLLEPPTGERNYPYGRWWLDWLVRLRCRAGGHACGPWWFNPGGDEPNPYCRDCGDRLL